MNPDRVVSCQEDGMFGSADLRKHSFFGGLSQEQIEKIVPLMIRQTHNAGDTILVEGALNDKIHFLVEGKVAVLKGNTLLCELAEGKIFGEMEVLDIMPSCADVKALTDVTVMTISSKSLREIYQNDLKAFSLIVMNLARDLSRRLRFANEVVAGGNE